MVMNRILSTALLSLASLSTLSAQTTFTPEYFPSYNPFPAGTVLSGDFNGDGKNDVLIYNPSGGSELFKVAYGDGKGNYPTSKPFPNLPSFVTGEGGLVQGVATDVNADGRADIVLGYRNATAGTIAVRLFLNNGSGFTSKGDIYSFALPSGSAGVTYDITPALQILLGDYDSDGHGDIAVRILTTPSNNPVLQDNNLAILYGSGTGAFTPKTVYTNRVSDLTFAAADINDDGPTDLTGTELDGSIHIFRGSTSRTFTETTLAPSALPNPAYTGYPPVIADFDGNGYKDIAYAASPASGNGQNELGLGTVYQSSTRTWKPGSFTAVDTFQSYLAANPFLAVDLLDYNKDAKPDVFLIASSDANTHPNSADLLLNKGTHALGACAAPAVGLHVCSPGSSSASPVKFSFSATSFYPLRKMEVWVDGVKKSETYHVFGYYGYSDVSLSLSAGKHTVSFFSGTFDGDTTKKTITVTVP